MADLPESRVLRDKPPFTGVGVHYFGPFHVKRGRSLVKGYGVTFTCLAIWALHTEVAESLIQTGSSLPSVVLLPGEARRE